MHQKIKSVPGAVLNGQKLSKDYGSIAILANTCPPTQRNAVLVTMVNIHVPGVYTNLMQQ
jgi:hypothetical protein